MIVEFSTMNRFTRVMLLFASLLAGCSTYHSVRPTDIHNSQVEIPEDELLDVGIVVFDALPAEEETDEDEPVFAEIRKSESRYIPYHLKTTMQQSGQWGAVQVTPSATDAVDLLITGEIVRSDGEALVVKIDVQDASGRVWMSKTYEHEAKSNTYSGTETRQKDAFQDTYNTIANDIVEAKAKLDPMQLRAIRKIAELKYANALVPEAFDDNLEQSEDGIYSIKRLPSGDDPMVKRILSVREREYMLTDTLNDYYGKFYEQMWPSYENWRKAHREESQALNEVKSSARNRAMLGAAAIVGAIALEVLAGGNTATLRNVMVLGGAAAVKSGWDMYENTKIHSDAIRELDQSFDAEVAPMVVDLRGETVELTGSAEAQYQEWRRLLGKIYESETGFALQDEEDSEPQKQKAIDE